MTTSIRYGIHKCKDAIALGDAVISVDPQKKEWIGDFQNGGQEWQPTGKPEAVRVYDVIDPALGKVAPSGVYDRTTNQGWGSVGMDHAPAELAVDSLRRCWRERGPPRYPKAIRLLITAACRGSHGYRVRWWRVPLQQPADELGLIIPVCPLPSGTRQWNQFEHRLFCHITQNWRGRPLLSREVVVNLIGNTTTAGGLKIPAKRDENSYTPGIHVSAQERAELAMEREAFHGEWNDKLSPWQSGNLL